MAVAPSAGRDAGAATAIKPSLEQARELAGSYNLIPLSVTFVEDCETPVSAFLKLRALDPFEPTFLLESAEQGQRVGRWSFIGFQPRAVLRWSLGDGGDPYAIAAERIGESNRRRWSDAPPFTGGAVGVFGYDLVRSVEPLGEPGPDPLGVPDMALMLTDALVVFDHLKHTVTILANADLRAQPDVEKAYADAAAIIAQVARRWPGRSREPSRPSRRARRRSSSRTCRVSTSKRWWRGSSSTSTRRRLPGGALAALVGVRAGRGVLDLPRPARGQPEPVHVLPGLRRLPGRRGEPEPLLTVSGRHVSTKPIAGTRPRGATPEEDRRIAAELLADEKERAEHVMLVDLGRNDLGRVCEYGSVTVDELMEIESYSHVMHIVSSVSGTLREEVGAMDALRSVLPAGTLSGAPKVRAMQIIDELEPVKRGGYGGAIGYLSYAGDLDTAIHIRTVVVKDGVAHVQAGGGTVADAKPEYEYEESVAKCARRDPGGRSWHANSRLA